MFPRGFQKFSEGSQMFWRYTKGCFVFYEGFSEFFLQYITVEVLLEKPEGRLARSRVIFQNYTSAFTRQCWLVMYWWAAWYRVVSISLSVFCTRVKIVNCTIAFLAQHWVYEHSLVAPKEVRDAPHPCLKSSKNSGIWIGLGTFRSKSLHGLPTKWWRFPDVSNSVFSGPMISQDLEIPGNHWKLVISREPFRMLPTKF